MSAMTTGNSENKEAVDKKPSFTYLRYHRGDEETRTMKFHQRTREQMFEIVPFSPHNARVEIASQMSSAESLKKHGFCLERFTPSMGDDLLKVETDGAYHVDPHNPNKESDISRQIREKYAQEVMDRIKSVTGAKYIFFMSHATRFASKDVDGNRYLNQYASFCHTDYSDHLLAHKERFLTKRGVPKAEVANLNIAFYNSWQPVQNPVYQNPLIVLDWQTLREGPDVINALLDYDIVPSKDQIKNAEVTLLSKQHANEHRWYLYPQMTPQEILIFNQLDERPGVARRCYHTSFYDTSVTGEHPPRQSIEMRFLLAFENQPQPRTKL